MNQRPAGLSSDVALRGGPVPLYGALIAAALLLTGCAHTRYVTVPCLTPEQLQQRKDAEPPKVGGTLTGDAQKDVRIIGGSAKELRVWGVGNLGILEGCTG